MSLQRLLESFIDVQRITPAQLSLVTAATFVVVTMSLVLIGRLLLGFGRNRLPAAEAIGSKRPPALGVFTYAFAWAIPIRQTKQEQLQRELNQAGYYHKRALEEYLGLRNAAMIGWLLVVGATMVALASPQENITPRVLLAGMIVLIFIFALPRLILSTQAAARCKRIQDSLPDALDLINMTVTGGLPLREAIKRAGGELRHTYPDISCELTVLDLQTETGSLELALRQFAKRLDIPDVTALASMVQHAERIGGQVSTAFREFADSIRRSRRQRAEERGNRSSVQLLLPIALFLAPPIYILLLGPAVIELKNFVQQQNRPGGALAQSPSSALSSGRSTSTARTGAPPAPPAGSTPAAPAATSTSNPTSRSAPPSAPQRPLTSVLRRPSGS
ncbi:MAG TPA: type II secretion system F family protein [Pirellulaceae bacterium]|nr:type II secretion system F family protein [Pirellulaceae bacterium]